MSSGTSPFVRLIPHRSSDLIRIVAAMALVAWLCSGTPAQAKGGGGGHGGGGHGGGGHVGGGHVGGGGYHGGGYHGGGGAYHPGYGGYHGGYNHHYYPGGYWGGFGYLGYPYGYGYGYGQPTYASPIYGVTSPAYTYPAVAQPAASATYAAAQGPYLGIDETPVVDARGQGMRVEAVYPGSAAERAGLRPGDVIHSANGYLTQVHGNLTWIIASQGPGGVLNLDVRRADGQDVMIAAQLP